MPGASFSPAGAGTGGGVTSGWAALVALPAGGGGDEPSLDTAAHERAEPSLPRRNACSVTPQPGPLLLPGASRLPLPATAAPSLPPVGFAG